ncbi:MAG: hypothetical protein RBQ97_07025 [Acholeplasma sp.]|nr:hypothetical protein [Acholeplasma sp.]
MGKQFNELNLHKLTPSRIDNMNYYKESLDFIFRDSEVLNIAITGAYGAGKSSVIKSYKALHKEKKFIHISLTNFEKNKLEQDEDIGKVKRNNLEDNKSNKLDESEIEGKILNQLIYQINTKKIQQTKFKIKKDVIPTTIIKETIIMSLFLLFLLYAFKFKEIQVYISNLRDDPIIEYLGILTNNSTFVFSIALCTGIAILYLFKIIRKQLYNPIFKKIKLKGNEIEIFENDEESYFNKHMDEILYLFRNSDVDAIVFEDIDRYENNIIFSKLREINDLINNEINNKDKTRPIRFLYLIRDDIFTSKDRTKFFDFILPIIPVIDSSNSYDKLLEYFGSAGPLNKQHETFLDKLDDFFLRDISLYIDDMRLLKNIYNEYVTYYGRLQITEIELDYTKLLALIIYKNIFPKDFIELQLNKGLVFEIFKNRDFYIREKKEKINLKLNELQDNIEMIKDEFLNDLDELDTLYLTSGQTNYHVNGKFDNNFNTRVEYIKEIKDPTKRVVLSGSIADIEKIISGFDKKTDYVARKKIIEQKMNLDLDNLEEAKMNLNREKDIITSLRLKDIILEDNIDHIFEHQFEDDEAKLTKYQKITNNHYYPLIKYLIKEGHIDETYFDYLSYFYENGITRKDKIFLRSITDGEAKEFNYKLKEPEKVVTYLRPRSLGKKEALNFNLLDYLLDNKSLKNNKEYLLYTLQHIRENERFDFVWSYLAQEENKNKLVKELNVVWEGLWMYLISNDRIEEKKKKNYMDYTLKYSDLEDINNMNIENCVTIYISSNKNVLEIDDPNINKMINAFISLEVCFVNINYNMSNKDLFKEVYKNDLYELNFTMITLILEKIYEIPYTSNYIEKNYTLVSSKPNQPLKDYIDRNANEYMELLLDNSTTEFTDSEECVLNILNNLDIEEDIKVKYIKNLVTIIHDIKEIEDSSLWEELFKNNLVGYSSGNILNYYFSYSGLMDPTITKYLNMNPNEIQFEYETVKENFGEDTLKFFMDVIKNNELTSPKYEMILRGFKQTISDFNKNGINEDKFEVLIKLQIIGMTKDNIKFVRDNHPELSILFISENIQDYIDCLDEGIIIKEEILDLLDEDDIPDEYKINLVEMFPENISLEDSNYNENLELYIIANKFDSNDLYYLLNNYDNSSLELKQAIEEICIINVEAIIANEYKIPYKLLLQIMENINIDDSYKKIIISNSINALNGMEVKKLMSIAKFYDFESLFEKKRPKIEITSENHLLLTSFKDKEWITKFEEDSNNPEYYRAYGRDYNSRIRKKTIPDELL